MKRGFTLIELIVVIAIIGVLLTISLAGIGNARVRSRDARRIADIRTIQSALEMHAFNDVSRSYPPDSASKAITANYCNATAASASFGIYGNSCFTKYLTAVPKDPEGNPYNYYRPACLTQGTDGSSTMTNNDKTTCSSPRIFAAGYGLHVLLEADNNEAKNDASPNDARSYDVMQ